jgi:hypothetical protein
VSSIRRRSEKLKHGGARGEHGESVHPILVAGGPSEEPVTVAKSRPNRAAVARSPSSVSFTVSVQNEFLLSCRSHRKKPHHKWCTVARAWALSSRWPWCPGGSVRPGRAEEEGTSRADGSWIDDRDSNKNNSSFYLNPSRRSPDGRSVFNEVPWTL